MAERAPEVGPAPAVRTPSREPGAGRPTRADGSASARRVLALQRSAGNRAVAQLAARRAAPEVAPPVSEGPSPDGPVTEESSAAPAPATSGPEAAGAVEPPDADPPTGAAAGAAGGGATAAPPPGGPGPVDRSAARSALAGLPALGAVRAELHQAAAAALGTAAEISTLYRVDEGGEHEADETASAAGRAKPTRGESVPAVVTKDAAQALDVVQGEPGERLPPGTAAGPGARLHRGPSAARAATALGARAFAVGDHVGVAADVDPASAEGESLVAHEAAHVVQDAAGTADAPAADAASTPPTTVAPAPPLEEPSSPFTSGPTASEVAARRGNVVRRAAIDAGSDNAGVLAGLFDAAATGARTTVAGAAVAETERVEGSLDRVETGASAAVGRTRQSVQDAFEGQRQTVADRFASGREEVESSSAGVVEGVGAAAGAAKEGIAASGAAGAQQVTTELQTREQAVKAEGEVAEFTAEAGRQRAAVDAASAQVVGQYSGHEKAADIRAGVQATATKAKGQIAEAVAAAQSESRDAAAEIAEQPRAAEPEQRGHAEQSATRATTEVDAGRTEAEQGVDEVRAKATAGLAGAEGELGGELAVAQEQSVAALTAAEASATAAIGQAKADTKKAFAGFGQAADARVGAWRQAAQDEQAEIEEEVGNLFVPQDVRPLVDDVESDAAADAATLGGEAAKLGGAHGRAATGFAGSLGQASSSTTSSLFQAVGMGLSSLSGAIGSVGSALTSGLAKLSPGFANLVTSFGSVIDRLLGSVRSSGDQGQGKVAAGMADATTSSRAEIDKIAASAKTEMATVAANDGDTGSQWSFWDGLLAALTSIGKNIVNLLWGFVWGDPWFADEDGGEGFAFVGDVIAGLLFIGDIRDILKWGIIKPLFMGEGYSWENALMIGLAVVGLIPLAGDVVKIVGKGGKLAIRLAMRALKKKLGQELAERLVKELGEEAAAELGEKLTKATIEKLLKSMDEKALKALVDEVGGEGVERLAKELSAEAIKELVEKVGTSGLKKLLAEFSPTIIKQIGELGDDVLKTVADDAPAFAEIIKDIGFPQIKALLKGNVKIAKLVKLKKGLGKHFADAAINLSLKHIDDILDGIGTAGAKTMLEEVGTAGLRATLDELGPTVLGKLISSGAITPKQMVAVTKLGKGIVEKYSPKTLARIAGLLGDSKINEAMLKQVLENIPKAVALETIENIAKDPTGKVLKCYSVLGWTVTNALISEMNPKGLADAAGDVEPAEILQMLKKCESPAQFARLCAAHGGAKPFQAALAGVAHANELELGPRVDTEPEPEAPAEAPEEPNHTPAEPPVDDPLMSVP